MKMLAISFAIFAAVWIAIHLKLIRLHVAETSRPQYHKLLRDSIAKRLGSADLSAGKQSDRSNSTPRSISSSDASWSPSLPRVLALYFPQFHADPINDRLWGVNFTDWTSLRAAPKHNRLGQRIPHPTELGYYDLSDATSEVAQRQGELAKRYGVDGFAYHHYWFYDEAHPGPNLHAPLELMLQSNHPDVPFCLHWAAMKWTSTWTSSIHTDANGKSSPSNGVLQLQHFPDVTTPDGLAQARQHYDWLRRYFYHPNYIKVNGSPLFMLYQKKPSAVPLLEQFRKWALDDGFTGLYITVGLTRPHEHLQSFWPFRKMHQFKGYSTFNKTVSYPNPSDWSNRTLQVPDWCLEQNAAIKFAEDGGIVLPTVSRRGERQRTIEIPGIITSFDNTPRRPFDEARIMGGSMNSDEVLTTFRKSLKAALYYESCCFPEEWPEKEQLISIKDTNEASSNGDDKFIVINAWNEWAEGMALEPSDVYGRRFLETIRDVKEEVIRGQCRWQNEAVPKRV